MYKEQNHVLTKQKRLFIARLISVVQNFQTSFIIEIMDKVGYKNAILSQLIVFNRKNYVEYVCIGRICPKTIVRT